MREYSANRYERAFEHWLLDHGIEYVRADEHKRLGPPRESVKNFDFLLYPNPARRVIVEIKGRTYRGTRPATRQGFECWVTTDDIESLRVWRRALGTDHEPVFVFAYRVVRPDVDFDGTDVLPIGPDRYLFFCIPLDDYRRHMKRRSPRWRTVSLPAASFRRCVVELADFLQ